jgi:phosphatidylglycerophosphatase A
MSATGGHESSGNAAPPVASPQVAARKPRFALFVATAAGLGYLPKAPGTWGSLGGLLLAVAPWWAFFAINLVSDVHVDLTTTVDPVLSIQVLIAIATATVGLWAATRAAQFWRQKDPQRVVIDEVSGQHLTYLLGLAPALLSKADTHNPDFVGYGFLFVEKLLNWKYLLLGFILFRLFDIWKPFPARQAESLPGGWGIMTDDWVAGIYAAIGLWIARAAGL